MKNCLFLIFFTSWFCFPENGTPTRLDSLMTEFSKQKGIQKAETSKRIGSYYKENSQYYKAIEYVGKAISILDDAAISPQEKAKAKALCEVNIGANYFLIGDHKKAMEYYIKAYKVIPENIDLLLNIKGVFSSQDNLEKAFYYARLAEKVALKTKNTSQLDRIWNAKSDLYFSKKDSLNGFKALEKSIEFSKKENDLEQLAITYTNYGDLINDSTQKFEYYLKSQEIWNTFAPNNLLAISTNISIANFYRQIANDPKLQIANKITRTQALDKAESLLLEQVENCRKIKHKGKNLQYALECLSYVYEEKKDYKKANDYFKDCVVLYDSLNSIDSKNKILNLESSYQINQKEKEIKLNQRLIAQEKKQKWFYILGILLLAFVGVLLFYQNRNRQKTNEKLQSLNSELDQANKIKLRFFSILNHDLRGPVSNLIHFLQLQKADPDLLDEETKNRMQHKTLSGAEDLLSSMESILLWSKGQMENFKPQPQIIAVNQLFEDTKKIFSGYHNITFSYLNADAVEIFTDEDYLKTIIRNLTGNAINAFKNTKNPTIIWKAWREKESTYLSITDNGSGASQKQFKALYDDKEVVGIKSGLGLHLIRDLAKIINCEILVDSSENGTTFTLMFAEHH